MFCLTKDMTTKFLKALKDGTVDPEKMGKMSSEERNKFISGIVGKDNALKVNSLFESKLLLKNQKSGMISWAKQVAGLKPTLKRDLISRIERMDKVLDPAEGEQFLHDLAATKLGVGVTQEEAKIISDMSQKVVESRTEMQKGGDRLTYGRAKVSLGNYLSDLTNQANKRTILEYIKNPAKIASDVAGNAKAIKSSMDNSAIFRQGWKTLWTHPGIWSKNALRSFKDIWKTFGKDEVMNELNADVVSRPNFDLYQKAKLDVGVLEESYPTSLPEKIPLLGKFYKASENAFTAFVRRQRIDVFDKYIEIAKRSGLDISDTKELLSIGKLVNSLTGRGFMGPLEKVSGPINNIFFSPRMLKSNIDTLTVHALDSMTPFARKQAAINLVRVVMGTATILGIARAISKDSVELDPRSSDFGKIKVGNTRFDVTGGMASLVTLSARLLTMSTKSTSSKIVLPLNSGEYGSQTGMDVVYNFFENKLSPLASVVKDLMKGRDFQGNEPTVTGELSNLLMPLPFSTFDELRKDPNSANIVVSMIADALGIATNTYAQKAANWETSTGKTIQQFKERVGPEKFKKANEEYNKLFTEWYNGVVTSEKYQKLDSENQQQLITSGKEAIQTKIFRRYNFKYMMDKKTPGVKFYIKSLMP